MLMFLNFAGIKTHFNVIKFISKKDFAKILIENIWEPVHDCIGGTVELGLHFSSKLGGAKIRTFSEHFLFLL